MSLELIREAINVNQVIGEENTQTVVENDIIVPDVKPDISNILLLDGDILVDNTDVIQDKILISGMLKFKILYVPDDAEPFIKGINTSAPFSYGLDIPNSRQGMRCKVKCDIEHIEYEILNGRKVNVKTIVKVSGKVTNATEQNIVYDIQGIEEIQILKKSFHITSFVGSENVNATVKETMEVPAGKPTIKEILRNDVKLSGKDFKITDNKVIVKGELNISTLYIGDDENQGIQFMEHEIPFTQFVDLPGISEEGGCEVDFRFVDYNFDAAEDSDGELRFLNGEISMNISVQGFEKKSIDIIEDAYAPKARLNLEKELFKADEFLMENKSQAAIKDIISIDRDDPDIAEIFNVLSKVSLSDYRIEDDKVVIEGVINNKILYLADNSNQPVFCHEQDVPLKHTIEFRGAKPEMDCGIDLDIEHCNYSMLSSKEVEIRLGIDIVGRMANQVVIPLIGKVFELSADEKRAFSQPSITIYFSQPGDTLWKIAKKYYTTVNDIQRMNNVTDQDLLEPGQQIFIPKRAV